MTCVDAIKSVPSISGAAIALPLLDMAGQEQQQNHS
jgi:hypothetical protein